MVKNADYWIKALELEAHPEGGHFRETFRSTETVSGSSLPERFTDDRCFLTSIYYLLHNGETSTLHRIRSDEIWYHHDGGAITIHVLERGGAYRALKLGRNVEAGESPQAVVGAGSWFGATVDGDGSYCLAGCAVAPGFDFSDFELAERDALLNEFPGHRDIIMRLTR